MSSLIPFPRVPSSPRLPSAPAPAEPPSREPPSSCAGPFTLLLPLPAPLLPPVCPLAHHPSIDFVTNRLHPTLPLSCLSSLPLAGPTSPSPTLANPREVRWSDTRRYVCVGSCRNVYCLYIFRRRRLYVHRPCRHRHRHRRRCRRPLNDCKFRTHAATIRWFSRAYLSYDSA